jgi:hypothetical protein
MTRSRGLRRTMQRLTGYGLWGLAVLGVAAACVRPHEVGYAVAVMLVVAWLLYSQLFHDG